MANVRFFALGGLDENGKNSYVIEIDNSIYVINCGTKVPITYSHGIDILIPNFQYLIDHRKRIKGVFITDIQNESFSALPWLVMDLPQIPIFCSQFSKYPILERISKYNIDQKNVNVNIIPHQGIKFKDDQVIVKPIPLAGALPGTIGFSFTTKDGENYLFLANLVDGNLGVYGRTDLAKIKKQYPKINALILDCGMANFNGKSSEKISIKKELNQIFKETPATERIIIGAYDQEMVSLQQVLDLAKKYNRAVVTYGRSYYQLLTLLKKYKPELDLPEILDYRVISNHNQNIVIIVTGTVERLFKRFIRITEDNDVYLKLNKNDHFVMLAPPINGLETESTYALDEIARITPRITDVAEDKFYRCRPTKQDIVDIVKTLDPQYFIPIQGLFRYLSVAIRTVGQNGYSQAKCILLQNGKVAHFKGGKLATQKERISQVGDTIVDGFGVGDISKEVIFERENLARDGVIIVSIMTNKDNKKLYDNISIRYVGVISMQEREAIDELINNLVKEIYYKALKNEQQKFSFTQLQNTLKKSIRKKVFKKTDKEPMVVISFNEV